MNGQPGWTNRRFKLSASMGLEDSPVSQDALEQLLDGLGMDQIAAAASPERKINQQAGDAMVTLESYLTPQGMPQIAATVQHPDGLATARFSWRRTAEYQTEPEREALADAIRRWQAEWTQATDTRRGRRVNQETRQ